MVLSGVATLAAVAVVAIVWTSSRTGTQAPPVVSGPASPPALAVIIDAVPWARVKEVVLDGGAAVPLRDDPTYTPLMLSLSPGRYHVSLEGPRGEFKTVDYDVGPGAELPAPLVFEPVTVDRYFGPAAKSKPPRAVSGGGR